MLNCTIMENGDLLVTANNETRQFIAESQRAGRNFWTIMGDLFESYFTNGSFEPFDASDGNPFVGLTSAPCIAESLDTLDDGTREIVGRFWHNADYVFTDELDELKRRGRFVYTLARSN